MSKEEKFEVENGEDPRKEAVDLYGKKKGQKETNICRIILYVLAGLLICILIYFIFIRKNDKSKDQINFGEEIKKLKGKPKDIKDENMIKFAVFGGTGVGKSTFGNFILLNETYFKVGHTSKSRTENASTGSCFRVVNNNETFYTTLIDTPGYDDTEERDNEFFTNTIKFLKEEKNIDAIIMVYSYTNPRETPKQKELFQNLINVFSIEVLKERLFFVYTSSKNKEKLDKDKEKKMELRSETTKKMKNILGEDYNPKIYFINTNFEEKQIFDYSPEINELLTKIRDLKKIYGSMSTHKVKIEKIDVSQKLYKEDREKIDKLKKDIENIKEENSELKKELKNTVKKMEIKQAISSAKEEIYSLENTISELKSGINDLTNSKEREKKFLESAKKRHSKNAWTWIFHPISATKALVESNSDQKECREKISTYNDKINSKNDEKSACERRLSELQDKINNFNKQLLEI